MKIKYICFVHSNIQLDCAFKFVDVYEKIVTKHYAGKRLPQTTAVANAGYHDVGGEGGGNGANNRN